MNEDEMWYALEVHIRKAAKEADNGLHEPLYRNIAMRKIKAHLVAAAEWAVELEIKKGEY